MPAPKRIRLLGPGTVGAPRPRAVRYVYVRDAPFDATDEMIAPSPVNATGDSVDLGRYWDAWIVSATVDAYISFKGPPTQNTPVTAAGSALNVGVRARVVYYKAANAGASGQLSIRVAGWRDDGGG